MVSLFLNSNAGAGFDSGNGSETRGLNDSTHHSSMQSDYKLGPMSAAEHREKYYATVRKPMPEQQSPNGNTLERIPEYSEDIYPYATYLPNEDNLAGNPMMSRYGTTNNAGTIPISASLYNPRHSMSSNKDVSHLPFELKLFRIFLIYNKSFQRSNRISNVFRVRDLFHCRRIPHPIIRQHKIIWVT